MPKTSNKKTTDIDKLVGRNILVHRLAAAMTQVDFGEKLGVTFQ
jgi:hypothetical protein